MRQALACVRHQGGAAVVIGNARFGSTLEIDPRELNMGKRLLAPRTSRSKHVQRHASDDCGEPGLEILDLAGGGAAEP